MKWALIFPGQGEAIGRWLDEWMRASSHARRRLTQAASCAGLPLDRIVERRGHCLRHTAIYQPVSTALSIAVLDALVAADARPSMVTGHSLGELAAASAAGFMSPDAAIQIAAIRGRAMAREAERHGGSMAALHTSDPAVIRQAIEAADGGVVVAAWNGPHQTVLSGDIEALRRLGQPATPLFVEGAWHSPAMARAVPDVEAALRSAVGGTARIPMIFNRTGAMESDPTAVPRLLAEQLTHPVCWTDSMTVLVDLGIEVVVTAGPARVLRGLIRACLSTEVELVPIERPDSLTSFLARAAA